MEARIEHKAELNDPLHTQMRQNKKRTKPANSKKHLPTNRHKDLQVKTTLTMRWAGSE